MEFCNVSLLCMLMPFEWSFLAGVYVKWPGKDWIVTSANMHFDWKKNAHKIMRLVACFMYKFCIACIQ